MRKRKIVLVAVFFSLFTIKAFSATIEANVNFNRYSGKSMHLGFGFSFTEMINDEMIFSVTADLPYHEYNTVEARLDYIIAQQVSFWLGGIYNYRWGLNVSGLTFGLGYQTPTQSFYIAAEGTYFFEMLDRFDSPNFDVMFRLGWSKTNFNTYFQYRHEEFTGAGIVHRRLDFIDFYVKMMSTVTSVYASLDFSLCNDFSQFNVGNFKFKGRLQLGLQDEMGTEYFFGAEYDQTISNADTAFGIFVGTKLSF